MFTCAGRMNGYYADPIYCNKFHYCATGKYQRTCFSRQSLVILGWQSMMECDEGLAYSDEEHDCVPMELSDCAMGNK